MAKSVLSEIACFGMPQFCRQLYSECLSGLVRQSNLPLTCDLNLLSGSEPRYLSMPSGHGGPSRH
jgi:hypothetical protein